MEDEEQQIPAEPVKPSMNLKKALLKEPINWTRVLLTVLIVVIVAAGGYLAYGKWGDTLLKKLGLRKTTAVETTTTAGTTATTATVDATAGWNTYSNSTIGLAFKYPSTWKATDDQTGDIGLTNTAKIYESEGGSLDPIIFQYVKDTSGASIDNYLTGGRAALKPLLKASVTIDGKIAYVIQGTTPPVPHDSKIVFLNGYVFTFSSNADALKDQDATGSISQIFAQIIGTIKFDPTAGWKTYENDAYDYTIKYPTTWTPTSNSASSESINPSAANNYIFSIETSVSQSSLDDYISGIKTAAAAEINNGQPGDTFGTQSQITVDGQSAIKIVNCTHGASAYKYDWYFVKKNSNIYKIAVTKVVGQGPIIDVNQYIPTAETMISTFKFDATAGWKTYTNSTYGLNFRYPAEWTLDKNPAEVDTGSAISVSYSVTEAIFKVSVFSSVQSLPKLQDPAGDSNATSLANYFSSQNMTNTAVKVGSYNGFDVNRPDIGGAKYYYVENAGKVYVFRVDDNIKATADKIFSTLQLK